MSLVAAAIVFTATLLLAGCNSGDAVGGGVTVNGHKLPARMATVERIDISVTPIAVSETGAKFSISFDTHSGDLEMDVAKAATLVVDGRDWPVSSYSGDGSGGHHREGALRFEAAGAVADTMRLTVSGLAEPVSFTWKLS